MAKARGGRDVSTPSLTELLRPVPLPRPYLSPLSLLEDRRLWHPDPSPPARAFRRAAARLVPAVRRAAPFKPPLWNGVRFAAPESVAVCVRRGRRREVLHALKIAGSGSGRFRKRRRSAYSSISCKR